MGKDTSASWAALIKKEGGEKKMNQNKGESAK